MQGGTRAAPCTQGRGDVCKATEQQSATNPRGAKAGAPGDAAEKAGRLQTDSQRSAG